MWREKNVQFYDSVGAPIQIKSQSCKSYKCKHINVRLKNSHNLSRSVRCFLYVDAGKQDSHDGCNTCIVHTQTYIKVRNKIPVPFKNDTMPIQCLRLNPKTAKITINCWHILSLILLRITRSQVCFSFFSVVHLGFKVMKKQLRLWYQRMNCCTLSCIEWCAL